MSSQYQDVHINDVGTIFRVTLMDGTAIVPVQDATVQTIRFYRPDSGILEKTSVFTNDGTDGQIEYMAVDGFLNEEGTWKIQGYVELPNGKWYSSTDVFVVLPNL